MLEIQNKEMYFLYIKLVLQTSKAVPFTQIIIASFSVKEVS